MEIDGLVQNGVIVLPGGEALPEGMRVTVFCPLPTGETKSKAKTRITLPLVPSPRPGSIPLTAEQVANLLSESDVSA